MQHKLSSLSVTFNRCSSSSQVAYRGVCPSRSSSYAPRRTHYCVPGHLNQQRGILLRFRNYATDMTPKGTSSNTLYSARELIQQKQEDGAIDVDSFAGSVAALLQGLDEGKIDYLDKVGDLVTRMADIDIEHASLFVYKVLQKVGLQDTGYVLDYYLKREQQASILAYLGNQPDWRELNVLDLMSFLMKNWETDEIKYVLTRLPKVDISPQEIIENNDLAPEPAENIDGELDSEVNFNHPSSVFGYSDRVSEMNVYEEKNPSITTEIKGFDGEVYLTVPYRSPGNEWLPDEIGVLIGKIFANEWELDYITYFLIELVTQNMSSDPSQHTWYDFLGYMGIILSSAMGCQKHWENEDIVWVYKDFCIDVGKWALLQWGDFREMEYREFVVDIVVQVANKRNDAEHDVSLIHALLTELTEEWDPNRRLLLSHMVEQRFKDKNLLGKAKNTFLKKLGVKKSLLTQVSHSRSFLWIPPEKYRNPDAWKESKNLLLTDQEKK
eukprot:TRINITY_DN5792_c0_g1_i2.p1 TRINITY_DN5792_c0_g1~~TRINITY_DN5792_c0_g1_i2.p1  ORF type:complete len:506 (+),score=95.24 TRINITY_DN5792_c0_g1_i2:33-1520(+)